MTLLDKLKSAKPIILAGLLSILPSQLSGETKHIIPYGNSWDGVDRIELLRSKQTGTKVSENFYTPVYYEGKVEGNTLHIIYCTTHRDNTEQDPAWINQTSTRTYLFVPEEVFVDRDGISQETRTAVRFKKLTTSQLVPQEESNSLVFQISQDAMNKLEETEEEYIKLNTGGFVDSGFTDFVKYLKGKEDQRLNDLGNANSPNDKYKCIVMPFDWTKANDANQQGFEYNRTISIELKTEHDIKNAQIYVAHSVRIMKETPEERLSQSGEGFAIIGPMNVPLNYVEPLLLPNNTRITKEGKIILPNGETIAKGDTDIREKLLKYQPAPTSEKLTQTTFATTNSPQQTSTTPEKNPGKTLENAVNEVGRASGGIHRELGRLFGR